MQLEELAQEHHLAQLHQDQAQVLEQMLEQVQDHLE
jgi:hypothetical protein